ncbi:MAG: DUF4489 domain-containing protein [Firmicutes bacterium]|nr:DUF4489 domain-containing protein [Bacillota bacterium]
MKENCIKSSVVKKTAPQKAKPAAVQLVCGKEVSSIRKRDFTKENLPDIPIVLARLELDLSGYNKALVSLDFYTMLEVRERVGPGENSSTGLILNFALSRECGGRRETLKTYQQIIFIGLAADGDRYDFRDSLYFIFCDELACRQECCIYTVELAGIEVIDPANGEDENIHRELNIEDSVLKAIIQETSMLQLGGVK